MSFPEIIFGICQECGGQGGDYASPGNGNADARDTTGNGLVLEYYDGKYVCSMCKQTLINNEQSLLAAEKHADEQKFRAKAGFLNSVPSS